MACDTCPLIFTCKRNSWAAQKFLPPPLLSPQTSDNFCTRASHHMRTCICHRPRKTRFFPAWCYNNQAEVGGALAAAFKDNSITRENLFITTKVERRLKKSEVQSRSTLPTTSCWCHWCAQPLFRLKTAGMYKRDLDLPRCCCCFQLWNTFHRPALLRKNMDTCLKDLGLPWVDMVQLHYSFAMVPVADET